MSFEPVDLGTDPGRVTATCDVPIRRDGRAVVYLMQRSVRARSNAALEVAAAHASACDVPLVVLYPLASPEGAPRETWRSLHHRVGDLADVATDLAARGVVFRIVSATPEEAFAAVASDACCIVLDAGYLRHEVRWRHHVASLRRVRTLVVESDVVVPTRVASDKREYAARTLRPRIWKHVERFLVPVEESALRPAGPQVDVGSTLTDVAVDALGAWVARADVDRGVPPVTTVAVGRHASLAAFEEFVSEKFGLYAGHRNQPQTDDVSRVSVPLKYGHLSPVELVLRARAAAPSADVLDVFLEELIVRRELAINYVVHSPDDYDAYRALPDWSKATLARHAGDVRTHVYDDHAFEAGETHDPYWNAAMLEMRETGYMHNYMRMYWGKKILEWSATPEEAFERAGRLNDRWFLDGQEPNGYCGVAWCFGLHDRPWTERPVFGTVRYMNAAGLERKADPKAYVVKVARASARERAARSPGGA